MKKNMMIMVLFVAFSSTLFAKESKKLDVDEVMKKAHHISYYQGDDGKAQILMKVYRDKKSAPIKKMFYMLRLDLKDGGEQMFFTYFTNPSDLRRTSFLVHKKIDQDDYRRLYIPASDKVLAIAGSRKQDPFMGSDFSYEDVSGRHFTKDHHKLISDTEKLDGEKVFVVESTPKVKESKTSKIKSWIAQSNHLPLKVQYFNHDGKVYREYTSDKVEDLQGFQTILKRTMKSPLEGSYTEMLINPKTTQYNVGLKKEDFAERSLKNPPMKHLK